MKVDKKTIGEFEKSCKEERMDPNKMMVSFPEQHYLFYYAKRIPMDGIYLEIGSMFGGSLCCAREAIRVAGSKARLISVEYSPHKELLNIVSRDPTISLIEGRAEEVLSTVKDESIDLIFQDTDKSGDVLKTIIRHSGRILKKGGLMLNHDWLIPGTSLGFTAVGRTVEEFFDKKVERIEHTTLWLANKEEILNAKEISG